MCLELTHKIPLLKDRALMLGEARKFFAERNILEIDCGALVRHAPIDSNIDVIGIDQDGGYLHTSPEYALKRLLSAGSGDIYFLGHVYRKGEHGRLHNPEFTMAEWYRIGLPFEKMIEETCAFITLLLGPLPIRTLSYREAFKKYAGIDYKTDDLYPLTKSYGSSASWPRDTHLHLLLTHLIEPKLGCNELTVLTHYPPSEAALACIVEKNGERVAERFEIYHQGVELCNGYHELGDAEELRKRFIEENELRKSLKKTPYTLDEKFLSAMQTHFPACCGVALGFDRTLMLRHKKTAIREIMPFAWEEV